MNQVEELCWWLKGKLVSSPQMVEEERAAIRFERSRADLESGYVFDWNPEQQQQSMLSSALSLLGGAAAAVPGSCQVLVRLHVAKPVLSTAFSARVFNASVLGGEADDESVTSLFWTALLLEQNRPNPVHRVPLHKVQTIRLDKANANKVALTDHTGRVLFQGTSPDAGKWMEQVEEARRVLGRQLEEEANNSGHYHEQKLQKIEDRKREREELRKQFAA